ncbi:MAG: DNA polymerase III subunit epsilon, partial [Alcaligenaceae bacterium]|nr:DNA polymerase III subunit epsilon [Alcaligenaceae bacterium]
KRNSLDALCERYGISNAHRTLHGALLDSELLAEVWLAMTRGQDSLLIDFDASDASGGPGNGPSAFDASVLRVLRASPEELAQHAEYVKVLDKAVGQPCLWHHFDAGNVAAQE